MNKALIKEEIELLKPKTKEAKKEIKTNWKEKIKTNWNYALKNAIEWFHKHCRGDEAVADEKKSSIRKSSKLKQPKLKPKEEADAINFIEKCLLPIEKLNKKTQTMEGQES
jgi:hypothetical protein